MPDKSNFLLLCLKNVASGTSTFFPFLSVDFALSSISFSMLAKSELVAGGTDCVCSLTLLGGFSPTGQYLRVEIIALEGLIQILADIGQYSLNILSKATRFVF